MKIFMKNLRKKSQDIYDNILRLHENDTERFRDVLQRVKAISREANDWLKRKGPTEIAAELEVSYFSELKEWGGASSPSPLLPTPLSPATPPPAPEPSPPCIPQTASSTKKSALLHSDHTAQQQPAQILPPHRRNPLNKTGQA
jgi:hypothetical protein